MYILWFFIAAIAIWVGLSVVIGGISYIQTKNHLSKLASHRDIKKAKEDFIKHVSGFSPDVAERIYDDIRDLIAIDNFPLLPTDDLVDGLNVDMGNLENFVENRCGSMVADDPLLPSISGDLARFILQKIESVAEK